MRAPRAAIVLWQSIALAAVLVGVLRRNRHRQPTFRPGSGRPSHRDDHQRDRRPRLAAVAAYVVVFVLTLMIGARLIVSVLHVAIATRRRRAHHRMVVDLVGASHVSAPSAACASGLRILDVAAAAGLLPARSPQPRRGQRGRAEALSDNEIAAILSARAGAPAGPPRSGAGDVHRGARRVSPVGPQRQRARRGPAAGRTARRRRRGAHRRPDSAGPRAGRLRVRPTPRGALAAGGPTTVLRVRRLGGKPNSLLLAAGAYVAAAAVLVVPPSRWRCRG